MLCRPGYAADSSVPPPALLRPLALAGGGVWTPHAIACPAVGGVAASPAAPVSSLLQRSTVTCGSYSNRLNLTVPHQSLVMLCCSRLYSSALNSLTLIAEFGLSGRSRQQLRSTSVPRLTRQRLLPQGQAPSACGHPWMSQPARCPARRRRPPATLAPRPPPRHAPLCCGWLPNLVCWSQVANVSAPVWAAVPRGTQRASAHRAAGAFACGCAFCEERVQGRRQANHPRE